MPGSYNAKFTFVNAALAENILAKDFFQNLGKQAWPLFFLKALIALRIITRMYPVETANRKNHSNLTSENAFFFFIKERFSEAVTGRSENMPVNLVFVSRQCTTSI